MTKVPHWTDEEAKLNLVKEELWEDERDYDVPDLRLPKSYLRWKRLPPEEQRKYVYRMEEQEALQAAKDGDFRPLRMLTDPDHILNMRPPRIRDNLSAAAWGLINQRLDGKKIGKPGAKKKAPDERRADNPVHDAATLLVPEVTRVLCRYYPDRKKAEIKAC